MIIFLWKLLRIGRIEDSYLRPVRGNAKVIGPLGGSSNGRTQDSDSCYLGSNPSPPATFTAVSGASPRTRNWPRRLAVRTSASHADNTSSILVGVTSKKAGSQLAGSGTAGKWPTGWGKNGTRKRAEQRLEWPALSQALSCVYMGSVWPASAPWWLTGKPFRPVARAPRSRV